MALLVAATQADGRGCKTCAELTPTMVVTLCATSGRSYGQCFPPTPYSAPPSPPSPTSPPPSPPPLPPSPPLPHPPLPPPPPPPPPTPPPSPPPPPLLHSTPRERQRRLDRRRLEAAAREAYLVAGVHSIVTAGGNVGHKGGYGDDARGSGGCTSDERNADGLCKSAFRSNEATDASTICIGCDVARPSLGEAQLRRVADYLVEVTLGGYFPCDTEPEADFLHLLAAALSFAALAFAAFAAAVAASALPATTSSSAVAAAAAAPATVASAWSRRLCLVLLLLQASGVAASPPPSSCQCMTCNGVPDTYPSGNCVAKLSAAGQACMNGGLGCYSSLDYHSCECPNTVGDVLRSPMPPPPL